MAGSGNSLLFIYNKLSGQDFLIDTGAEIIVVPASIKDKHYEQKGLQLAAANGTTIQSFGDRNIFLKLGDNQYQWRFKVAEVNRPIIGADFLRAN